MEKKLKFDKISDFCDIDRIINKINNDLDFKDEYQLEYFIDWLNEGIEDNENNDSNKFKESLNTTLNDVKLLYWIRVLWGLRENIVPNHNDKSTNNLNSLIISLIDSVEKLITEPYKYKIAIFKIKNTKLDFGLNLLNDAALIRRLAEKTKESRIKLGLKQKTLAEYIGISKYTLCRIENADYKFFPKDHASKISKYFGNDINEFMDLIPTIDAMIEVEPIYKFHHDLLTKSKYAPFMQSLGKIYRMGPNVFDKYIEYSKAFFQNYIDDNN
ncbi:MAG: helix-turn-helix transcriptional regulator [Clostridia bacterium]|nr:helix-turn-helix transcriptional regulator [Clostridia bacterium]